MREEELFITLSIFDNKLPSLPVMGTQEDHLRPSKSIHVTHMKELLL